MIKYNIVVCCYDTVLVNVVAFVIPGYKCVCVCVCVWSGSCLLCTTRTPNQELHMQPHLPRRHHNNTLLYCILSF